MIDARTITPEQLAALRTLFAAIRTAGEALGDVATTGLALVEELSAEPIQWSRDHDDARLSLEDALCDAPALEPRRVWKWEPGATEAKAWFAVRVPLDTNGDGEQDDEEIRLFPNFTSANDFAEQALTASAMKP